MTAAATYGGLLGFGVALLLIGCGMAVMLMDRGMEKRASTKTFYVTLLVALAWGGWALGVGAAGLAHT